MLLDLKLIENVQDANMDVLIASSLKTLACNEPTINSVGCH